MAKISVIIPCYNVTKYIDRCLASVTEQTIGINELEIICVDDASTDHTWEHLKKWEEKFPEQMIVIASEKNGRQGAARNIGLSYATAPWVAFVDSDDWLEPDYLQKLYECAVDSGSDLSFCRWRRDSSEDGSYFVHREREEESRVLVIDDEEKVKLFIFLQSIGYGAWGKLIKRSILLQNEIFFPENLAYEDTYWGLLLYFYVKRVYILEMDLYHYYVNPSSTVLKKNEDYHVDFLTVQEMKWEELKKRGLLDKYRDILEFELICTCYLGFLKALCLRYENPSYSLFLLLKELVSSKVGDLSGNPYLKEGLKEHQLVLAESLWLPIHKTDFENIVHCVRKILL